MVLEFKVLCSETRIDSTWFFGHATGVIASLEVTALGSQLQGSCRDINLRPTLGVSWAVFQILCIYLSTTYLCLAITSRNTWLVPYRVLHCCIRNLSVNTLRPTTYTRKGNIPNSPCRRHPPFLGPGADVAVGT